MKDKTKLLLIGLVIIVIIGAIYFIKNKDDENTPQVNEGKDSTDQADESFEEDSQKKADGDIDLVIKSQDDFDKLLASDKPKIIMFGSDTCVYCKKMYPDFEQLANLYRSKIDLRYVGTDKNPEIASQYPVQGVPAMMYINDDGSAFLPSEKYQKKGFYAFSEEGSETMDLVMSFGLLERSDLEGLIMEMLEND